MEPSIEPPRAQVYRHRLPTRLTHWTNAVAMLVLLLSGLQILNAHPRLYWGHYGASHDPALAEIAVEGSMADPRGVLRIGAWEMDTTGVLGVSADAAGERTVRAFPAWITLPSPNHELTDARRWHFFFAWVLAINAAAYLIFGLVNGHLRRDLSLTRQELAPRHLARDIWDHLRLRFPTGVAAARYNVLQKLAYLGVVVVLVPLIVLTGLTMSPGFNAVAPWLVDLFGGRQSARTLHFLAASGLVAFVIVHLAMVVLAGPVNEMRSMITGWFVLPREKRS